MNFTLKCALRQLAKSPSFTIVSIVMLALGIGMSTSTFSLTNSVLLRSMPFQDSQQLVRIFRTTGEFDSLAHSPGNYLSIKSAATSFSTVAAYYPNELNLAEPGQTPEQVFGLIATVDFLPTLGVQPFLGRGFTTDENQPGKTDVIVLTHAYWMRRFAGDPKIIGRTLRLGVDQVTVIGVLPPSFDHTQLWNGAAFIRPDTLWPNFTNLRNAKWYEIIARLKPGVSLRSSQPELTTIAARLAKDYPADNALDGLRVTDLGSSFVDGSTRKIYWLITGLAVSVLLIACANLASVQLARAFSRSHEFAVRSALGAGRLDLMAPLLVESLLIALGGGVFGVLLAYWANHLISNTFNGNFEIPIDGTVLLFASLAALLTGLTFGLAPAWLASRVSTNDAMKENARGNTSSRTQRWLKFALIVGQLACALVLVSAALSFGVAVKRSLKRDLGWKPADMVSGVLAMPYARYKEDVKKFEIVRDLKAEMQQLPGVSRVSIVTQVPLYGYTEQNAIVVEGAPQVDKGREPQVLTSGIDADYFETLGITLKAGRNFPASVKADGPQQVIVNETLARHFWPGESAVGKRLRFVDGKDWCEVIGVAGDVRMTAGFGALATKLHIYRAAEHAPSGNCVYQFILKSSLPPEALTKPVRKIIGDRDADIMVQQLGGVEQTLQSILAGNDLMIITLSAFAFIGLLIALIGLYGVISQLTLQRHREISVRMALGADGAAVVRLILGQAGRLILSGVLLGLIGAFYVSRFYQQTMPELQLPSPTLQLAITLGLCVTGLLACYLPAHRASRTDPVEALKAE